MHVYTAHRDETLKLLREIFSGEYVLARPDDLQVDEGSHRWNVVAPKGSEFLVAEAWRQVERIGYRDGVEQSELIAARVPGARVGPMAS